MKSNYGNDVFKQLEEVLTKVDTLTEEFSCQRVTIAKLKSNHQKEVTKLKNQIETLTTKKS